LPASGGYRLKPSRAYERDTRQFLHFLTGHCGGPPGIADIRALRPADLRAFLASAPRNDGAGPRTLARGLAGIRSLLRFLEKRGAGQCGRRRGPARAKTAEIPAKSRLTAVDARQGGSAERQLAEEPWIAARNAAVLTLLYGSGLRISEALGLKGGTSRRARRSLRVTGKGGKTRLMPGAAAGDPAAVADYRKLCPYHLSASDAPLFRGARGGPLNPAIVQREMEKCARAGLPETATPHALRHSFATHLARRMAATCGTIQELLGHASLSTTQIYTGVDTARLLDIYESAHPRA
jgi:integrase/recombinase XerC